MPREVFVHAATLEELDLSGNRLTSLPDDFAQLRSPRRLFLSNNPFETGSLSLNDGTPLGPVVVVEMQGWAIQDSTLARACTPRWGSTTARWAE